MRDLFVDFLSITQSFELNAKGEPQLYGELLFFPELRTFANGDEAVAKTQEKIAQSILEHADAEVFDRRLLPETEIEQASIVVELMPYERLATWREPLLLEFGYLYWQHGNDAKIGYVPGLGIEVVASDPKKFDEMLKDHILFSLNRAGVQHSLFDLALLQRSSKVTVSKVNWNAYPMTPTERYERDESGDAKEKKVLNEVAKQLNIVKMPVAFERDKLVEQLAWMLAGRRATSVLLVGESGVGKTALVHHLAERASTFKMGATPIYQTSGSRLVAGMTGFGEWQERCRKVVEEVTEKKAVMFFGNLFELMQVGQSSASSESLGSFFRPYLIRGEFVAIAECTPQQLALIEQIDPRILDAFRQLKIEPSTVDETLTILKKRNPAIGFQKGMLERLVGLHQRYSGYSAFPGKAVRFLDRIVEKKVIETEKGKKTTIGSEAVDEAFAAETGMPEFLINESVGLELDSVSDWFGERLKGQDAAVDLVIDTIAAIKARLTRPGKPLASFLFIGPTGVGKTELGKTLAEFFYGSKDRLIRLDMSEYATPGSAGRLAAGGRNDDEGILTAQMRDQPFSVLLLDEFEKADASVYDLFLQVLGEARLTDGAGRLADFSNAIVILTSNLGAREFRLLRPGFNDSSHDIDGVATDHFTDSVKKSFRPEFFNRIDRIVPFLPLSREAVRAVVRREIERAEHRDGLRNRNVSLIVPEIVIDRLADLGYDPRYGARPVKRAIEQWLLRHVSEFFCEVEEGEVKNGFLEVVRISEADVPIFEFKKATDESRDLAREKDDWFTTIPQIRREFQSLAACALISELQSERNRIRLRIGADVQLNHNPLDRQRLSDLNELLDTISDQQERILQVEEHLLLAKFHEEPSATFEAAVVGAPTHEEFAASLLNTLAEVRKAPPRIVLILKGDSWAQLTACAFAYLSAAASFGSTSRVGYWKKHPDHDHLHPDDHRETGGPPADNPRSLPVSPQSKVEADDLLIDPPTDFGNLAIELTGGHAAMRFAPEIGLHVFIDDVGEKSRVAVGFFDEGEGLEDAWLPEAMMLDPNVTLLTVRRTWDQQGRRMRDSRLGNSPGNDELRLPWEFSAESLAELADASLVAEARGFLW